MEKELPKGWVETKLGIIAEWGSGGTPNRNEPKYYDGTIPWVKTGDLNDSIILEASEYITELGLKKSSAKLFPKGSIIVAMYGATIGKTAKLGIDATTNQACAVAIASKIVIPEFLHYFLKSEKQKFIDKGKGGAQPNISQTVIKEHPFPLPPLPEQQRIVAKLDTLFGHLDALKTRLEHIPQLLKEFRQKVLTQTVTGKLTEEWRDGKELEEWQNVELKTVCKSITDGDHQAPPQVKEGIPFLVISNVSKGFFDFESITRFVPRSYFESLKDTRIPKKGDVLYTVTGSFGIPILVDFDGEFCFQRHIAILKPDNSKINSSFLQIVLSSTKIMEQARDVATGTAQLTVPLSGVRNFIASIPLLEEQQEIVRHVETLFAKADQIEAGYQKLKAKVDQLPQALLAKAFRGELVPQLPTDGDARDLLEQIKRAKGGKMKK